MTPLALAWSRFRRHRGAVIGLAVLLALTLLALAAPAAEAWLGVEAETVDLLGRLEPPSAAHPLGTDEIGRDVLVRLLYGGQVSLAVGLAAALASAGLGTLIGLAAGTAGGRVDAALMRVADGVLALPLLPLLIVLAAVDPAKLGLEPDSGGAGGVARLVVIIALVGWTTAARLVRAATLSVRRREFVLAAVALGAGPVRIATVHILPNVLSPAIVATTLSIGSIILLESALSFLGFGVQPPLPSWGNMLSGALEQIWAAPALAIWPGALIFVTVMAFNFIGDGLQDAFDPRAMDRR